MILAASPDELVQHFGQDQPPVLTARYNIAPSQLVAPKADPGKRGLALLKWGLVPYWSNDGRHPSVNARAETVGGLSSFSDSFRHKRCIIPATGSYEWRTDGKKKVPQRFRLASVWGDGVRRAVVCVGRGGEATVHPLRHHGRGERTGGAVPRPHARGPRAADYALWFDTDAPLKDAHALLKPYPAERMAVGEANVLVNSPKNEGPRLLDPAA